MKPTDEGVAELIQIYEKLKGVKLTQDAAIQIGSRLLALFDALTRFVGMKDASPKKKK